MTNEHKKKISDALKGHKVYQSKERNDKISRSLTGKKASQETKEKLSRIFKKIGSERAKKAWETKRKNGTDIPWNKGKKIEKISNEKNPQWKGGDVSYFGLHAWVQRKLGSPSNCENPDCVYPRLNSRGKVLTKPSRFHWANKSKLYKRELSDWIRLCVNCHSKFDNDKLFL